MILENISTITKRRSIIAWQSQHNRVQMVARATQPTAEPPRKRPRLDQKKLSRKFTSVEEIRAGLRTQNHDSLTESKYSL